MRITARGLAAGVVATALAASMVACSSSSNSGVTTLNALFMQQAGYSQEQITQMVDAYQKDHPDVKVESTFVSYEALHDKIVTSAPAGTYDVVLLDVIWPAEFATKDIVLDVTSRYPAAWKDDMLGGAYHTAEYNGKFYGVPWGPSTKFFYYNKDMVAAVGATEADLDTWAGVLGVAQKIRAAGLSSYPIAWSWAQAEAVVCDYGQLLGAFGGQFTDAAGNLAVNNEAGVQTLTWMKQTIDDGLTNPASTTFLEDDVQKTLAQGETAFGLNWEATLGALNDETQSQVAGKIGILPTPAGPAGLRPGINGAMALSIPTKSKHPDAAWDLITYLTSQAVQDQYPTGWPPNWKSSYTDTAVTGQAPELFKAAAVGYASLILRPTVANYNSTSAALQAEIQNALLGQKSPQKAMDDAVASSKA
ncbi:MAG: extracellular solute-binding protein [Propionibacteriaceae bacterium]|jgi:multiple sugar transport system substrate-binding protein|nr:extracellular solute-binding protein [Propionibacteriaceae bacterium]